MLTYLKMNMVHFCEAFTCTHPPLLNEVIYLKCSLHPSIFVAGSAKNKQAFNGHHQWWTNPPTVKKKQPAAGKLKEKLPSAVPNVKSPSGPPEDIELVGHEGSRT